MKNFTKIITTLCCLFSLSISNAATITAAATGAWTATSTWVGGVVPGAADNVIIPTGKTVTYTVSGTTFTNAPLSMSVSGTIVFETAAANSALIFPNAITITVESGGTFKDNTLEGGYNLNGKVSSFVFKTGSAFATGANNAYGNIYVIASSAVNYTNGTIITPSTPKPFTVGGNGSTTVLPLTLTSFVAYPQISSINLTWQTANEVNVESIYVERSTDGISFTRINKLSAKGSGSYAYNDDVSALNSSVAYYRLMIVDKDGSVSFSKVVNAQLGSANKQLSFYPNPVVNNLYVQFVSAKQEKVSLRIINQQGQILHEETLQANIGNVSTAVNTSTLAIGTYILQVKGSSTILQQQFVKE